MTVLSAEFQDILKVYVKLVEDLSLIIDVDDPNDPQALVKTILDNQDCLTQIQQINARLVNLKSIWEQNKDDFDIEACVEIRGFIDGAKAHVLKLQEICDAQTQKVYARREQLSEELKEIGKGSRYLHLLKPAQENYPKFIDSAY